MSDATYKSPRGRILRFYGDTSLLTMDRLAEFGSRIDTDPRLVTLSITPSAAHSGSWLRSTAPAGAAVAIAEDAQDLVGPLPAQDADVVTWARAASERGLWHDWYLTNHRDVAGAQIMLAPAELDLKENADPSSAHAFARATARSKGRLRLAVDVTWLGPYETGAQVLTTAAINALAQDDRIAEIILVGLEELPDYARHLDNYQHVRITTADDPALPADAVWFPNQVDGRSKISDARRLGRRVVATYLDLIAYDNPRYHGSAEGWAAYRALQRRTALAVDGITTISADVAQQLLAEVPLLDQERVQPIPLGLDHITRMSLPAESDAEIEGLEKSLGGRRFLLVLGNDFLHKNRDFAISVWQEVLRRGESCDLVLAGLHVKSSSSKEYEDALLKKHVDLRGRIHTLGHVSSATRSWLLLEASAVLYPSSAEGFGFIPYEAANLGTPSTFADFGPLHEISQVQGLPKAWTVEAFAADVTALLADEQAAQARLTALDSSLRYFTWHRFATALVDFLQRVIDAPPSPASGTDASDADAELAAVLSSRSYKAGRKLARVLGKK